MNSRLRSRRRTLTATSQRGRFLCPSSISPWPFSSSWRALSGFTSFGRGGKPRSHLLQPAAAPPGCSAPSWLLSLLGACAGVSWHSVCGPLLNSSHPVGIANRAAQPCARRALPRETAQSGPRRSTELPSGAAHCRQDGPVTGGASAEPPAWLWALPSPVLEQLQVPGFFVVPHHRVEH